MGPDSQAEAIDVLAPFVEQYEYECMLSSRNADGDESAAPPAPLSERTLVGCPSLQGSESCFI